ncbi:hypothetical protein, partial [Nocardia farcinica]|uniref:hypothetical protein n=1 Tax=Nocardia farcinica TaxID=37329 RepID=UPI002456A776
MDDRTLYIIDRVVLKPGTARAFLDAYLTGYVPGARERGLTLERILVSPPVWIEGEPNTVTATWTVRGPSEWWAAAVRGPPPSGPGRGGGWIAPVIGARPPGTAPPPPGRGGVWG